MNYKHGLTEICKRRAGNPEWRAYLTWIAMRRRCTQVKCKDYPNYGGRGITVCERWHTFENFVADLGLPPAGMSIERDNNDGNYELSNCRWADRATQNANKRNRRELTYNGQTMSVTEWARHLGVPRQRLKNRLHRGWPVERILIPDSLEQLGQFGAYR